MKKALLVLFTLMGMMSARCSRCSAGHLEPRIKTGLLTGRIMLLLNFVGIAHKHSINTCKVRGFCK